MEIDKLMSSRLPNSDYSKPTTSVVDETKVKEIPENKQSMKEINDVDKEQLKDIVSTFNDFMEPIRTNLKFELHDRLDRYYVSVIDSETDEVIKEIPPKKMLDMYAEMAEFMGLLIDRKI